MLTYGIILVVYKHKTGFSLVELSVVLFIISLLLTVGSLTTNIARRSELVQIMERLKHIESSVKYFKEIYGYDPGNADIFAAGELPNPDPNVTNTQTYMQNVTGSNKTSLTGDRVYYFWYHLKLISDFKINFAINNDGTLNKTNTNIKNGDTSNVPSLVPSLQVRNSYVNVRSDLTNNSLVFEVISNNSMTKGVVSTKELHYLDQKYDDGNASTGKLRLSNTSTCYNSTNSSKYNLSSSQANKRICKLLFIYSDNNNERDNDGDTGTGKSVCSTNTIGSIRFYGSCPKGYDGNIIEICSKGGTWKKSYRYCSPKECNKYNVGETYDHDCEYPYWGITIKECTEHGTWKSISDCAEPNWHEASSCTSNKVIQCEHLTKGTKTLNCSSGKYAHHFSNGCSTIQCNSTVELHELTSSTCSSPYKGKINSICLTDGKMSEYNHNCVIKPTYITAVKSSQDVACPKLTSNLVSRKFKVKIPSSGQTTYGAEKYQYYHRCQALTCSGYPIGTIIKSSYKCKNGLDNVIEECTLGSDGTEWKIIYDKCKASSFNKCSTTVSGANYGKSWNATISGTSAVNKCTTGYVTRSGKAPYRACINGKWGVIRNPCVEQ